VKATNSDGLWSQNIAKIFIVITPPFWRTWWAYSIYAIVFIGSLIFLREVEIKRRQKKEAERLRWEREEARLREAELKAKNIEQEKEIEKQKIRNRIAQDLHDEIGSNLSSISLMSELIQIDGKINPEAIERIHRIQKVAKGSTQAIRDIVWLTNPSSDNIKDLVSKMNEVANDLLGRLKWNFDFPSILNELNLLPETKRNVFFIYKEALNNIVKHSGAENVLINLKTEKNQFILEISDDGKGFDINVLSKGNGLKNMHNRAKEIDGKLQLQSNPQKGTRLVLAINITQVRD
jgi:signal transduction histidine kinase